jgi:subtilisin family serine protease
MAVIRSSRLVACASLLLTVSTGEAKLPREVSGSLVRSVPVLPSPGEGMAPSPQPPLSMSDYSRLGTGRLTTLARAQVLGFVTGMTFPQRPALDEQGRLRLLVRQSAGGQPLVGFAASTLSQTVSEVRVRARELPSLLADPTIVRIDGVHRLRPLLDQSRTISGAAWVNEQLNLRGKGVMVAIVDTGVDFRHADLRDQAGKTRIAYLLSRSEQRDSRHPEIPDYDGMQVHTAKDLDELLDLEAKGMQPPVPIRELDINGHGTHLAGIVGSTGLAHSGSFASGRYVGMASESSLCIAKVTRDEVSFDDPDILRGVRFCLDRAEENNQPIVVNLSLGADGGRHDGSSLLELALDELFANRPGRVLVAAAGNAGDEDPHASSSLLQGSQSVTLHLTHQDVPVEQSSVSLELYYDASAPPHVGGAAELTLVLYSPSGRRFEAPMGQALQASFDDEGEAVIDATDVAATGTRGVVITLGKQPGKGPPKEGDWRLELRGKTMRYDLWRVEQSDDLTLQLRGHLDLDGYVGIPASAASAICVGSLRSRLSWKRADGKDASFDRETGRVSTFSSGGPLSSGGFAPDVLAPGEFILSALSSSSLQSDPRSSYSLPRDPGLLIADDGLHGVMRGTSQAAPHVAGAVALMLELFPKLTATEVRELLRTTSRLPFGQGYGPRRGFGQMDLQAVFERLGGGMLLALSPPWSDVGVNRDIAAPNAQTITVTVTPRDVQGRPLGRGLPVSIASDRGAWIGEVRDDGHGRYERTLLAQGPRGSQATIEVRVGGVLLDQQPVVYFVGDRSEIGQPFVFSACAMSTARGRVASPWMLVALPLLRLLLRRRDRAGRFSLWLGLLLVVGCSESTLEPLSVPATSRDKGGDFYWAVRDALLHPSLVIHLGTQQAELFEGETVVAQSSICSGRASRKTPKGSFAVLEKVPQYISGRYGDYVTDMGEVVLANVDSHDQPPPPGTTFRGTPMPYFMRIVGGIGLHAGPLPGHPDSHGCVRFPRLFAQRLFETVPLGTKVVVTD